jgi:hypothetical protein
VQADTNAIVFSDSVSTLADQMVALMTRTVTSTHGLSQLEPLVMAKLFCADRPKLQLVHPQEDAVLALQCQVHTDWTRIVAPLLQHKQLFERYSNILVRDNEAYIQAVIAKGSELTLADVRGELNDAEKMLSSLYTDIPVSVCTHWVRCRIVIFPRR